MTDEVTDQASEQSAVERIASKFGFPKDDQVEEPSSEAVTEGISDLADLDWDGKTYKVPSKLKDAFMKNEDYTKKTQELAQQRASLDQVRTIAEQRQLETAFSTSIQAEQQELHVIDAYLAQAQKVDWSSMSTDQILRQKIELDQIKDRRSNIQQSIVDKREKFKTEVDTKLSELRLKTRDIASKAIQGFSDETESAVRAFAGKSGMAEAEINMVLLDPRSYQIMWKAMKFDAIQASAGKTTTAVDKVLRPGAASERIPANIAARNNFTKAMNTAKTSAQKANLIEQNLAMAFKKRG